MPLSTHPAPKSNFSHINHPSIFPHPRVDLPIPRFPKKPGAGQRTIRLDQPHVNLGPAYLFFGAAGTFFPDFRASESPIAIACFGLVTFLPLRPLFSLPRFISCISVSTFLLADGLYFRVELFFADVFLEELFFAADFLLAAFFAGAFFAELFFAELFFVADFFDAAFFVAIGFASSP
jgi:hypothetical protein